MPADSHPGRLRFAGLGYALTVLLAGTNLATPLYAAYERVFRLSPLDVTLLVAVYAAAVVVALLICGPLSDTAGYRPVLVAGLAAAACGAALLAAASGPGWLFAGRAVQGLAVGTCSGALTAGLVLTEPRGLAGPRVIPGGHGHHRGLRARPGARRRAGAVRPGPARPQLPGRDRPAGAGGRGGGHAARSLGVTGRRWQPRWPSLPARSRPAFLAPAVVSLLAWAVAYVVLALVPSYAAAALGGRNLLVDGAAAGSLLLVAALTQAACRSWDAVRAQQAGLIGLAAGLTRADRCGAGHHGAGRRRGGAVRGDGGGGRRAGARVHGRHPADQRPRPARGPRRDRLPVLRADLRG